MTLPASGTISLSQVNVELGRSSTALISLGESAVRTLAGVPSGAISMSNLWGKSAAPTYRLDSDAYIDYKLSPDDAQVDFYVRSNGTILATSGIGATTTLASYNWITPTTGSTTHYVRATLTSGTFTSGTTGSWLALTSDRSWRTAFTGTFGSKLTTATFQIATDAAGSNIVASASISLEAYVDI